MKPEPKSPADLERLIHRTLRELPARRAPSSLEQRVLAELARRAALPWWRKSFAHWPLAARAVFLVACLGLVKLALMGSVWVMAGFDSVQYHEAFAQPVVWLESLRALFHAGTGFIEVITRNIPPLWLYGGLAFVATLYAALFGLGAAAYRLLYAQR